MIGRFPIYTEFEPVELSNGRKWEYVLNLIRKISVPLSEFIEGSDDPILRLIGPLKAKKSKSMIIISSPVSSLFKILFSEFPKITSCTTSLKSKLVEITTLEDLFESPSEFKIEFEYPIFDLEQAKYYFKMFTGVELSINFDFVSIKRKNEKTIVRIMSLNSDTSAIIKFLRYICIGGKYNFSDVRIKKVV